MNPPTTAGPEKTLRRRRSRVPHVDYDAGDAVVSSCQGDAGALDELVVQFSPMMRCTARTYLSCVADVEDAVQDAWTAFLRYAHTIEAPSAIAGWLHITAARAALKIACRQGRCRPVPHALDVDDRTVELEAGSHDEVQAVSGAVGRLNERDRELISLLFE